MLRNEALRKLAVGKVSVPDQLMGAGTRDPGDVERHGGVFEHRQVPYLENVPEVPGVGRGPRIRLVPALIAGTAGELGEGGSTLSVGFPFEFLGWGEPGVRDHADLPPDELGHGGAPLYFLAG